MHIDRRQLKAIIQMQEPWTEKVKKILGIGVQKTAPLQCTLYYYSLRNTVHYAVLLYTGLVRERLSRKLLNRKYKCILKTHSCISLVNDYKAAARLLLYLYTSYWIHISICLRQNSSFTSWKMPLQCWSGKTKYIERPLKGTTG